MRKMLFMYFIVPCILMNQGCKISFLSPEDDIANNAFSSFDCCLRIRDSAMILIDLNTTDTNLVYQWETTLGKIEGQGKEVTYVAPDGKGTSTLHVRVLSGQSVLYERSFSIYIYKQLVILKADDLTYYESSDLSPNWYRFIDFINTQKIAAGIGIKGYSLVAGNSSYYALVTSLQRSGYFEIWNHGYTHLLNGTNESGEEYDEFYNTSYEYQKNHLLITQNLAKAKLDITLHTFGAPGNAIDTNTLRVIDENSDIKVWLNGDEHSQKVVLKEGGCFIEYPIFFPSYQNFLADYDPNKVYYLFQFHPNEWNDQGFEEYKKIIIHLIQMDVTFITPYEYYQSFYLRNSLKVTG
jgi:Uncharacterized protein conserved in bacteria (DUF2334)